MTQEEFEEKWKYLRTKQKKFILAYLETFDPKESATRAGYSPSFIKAPVYKIMRKVDDLIDYLIAKNNVINSIVKPTWVLTEYMKMYERTASEITKQNILKELSKILQMQNDGSKVEVNNNIPQTPVKIVFNDEE